MRAFVSIAEYHLVLFAGADLGGLSDGGGRGRLAEEDDAADHTDNQSQEQGEAANDEESSEGDVIDALGLLYAGDHEVHEHAEVRQGCRNGGGDGLLVLRGGESSQTLGGAFASLVDVHAPLVNEDQGRVSLDAEPLGNVGAAGGVQVGDVNDALELPSQALPRRGHVAAVRAPGGVELHEPRTCCV
ncbi:short-chain dehydrogenase reductase SDR, putative [Babesia ovata]|uniref:Short-chain dehydrogenase reductase SDR, putative n=1 Tax=Babesia ovata TaxID=189622 RepID=A0A2H6KCM4_9APIC|nr:short-chain dehydrogenase reductase SDR, putative [Babesia ovata]GBE60750.1 short-chain dehydrogenase reductase SDR, putative [Babesia ovata]